MNNRTTEYYAYLNGSRIDSNGYKGQGVTAYTKKDAERILAKAKKYYHGTYRVSDCWISSNKK